METARETSGVTTRLIVRYVRERGGDEAVARVLERAGSRRTAAELEDESAWTSYAEKIALFRAAAEVFDDADVARRIGETVIKERVGLGVKVLLRSLGSPNQVLREVSRTAAKFSTTCDMRTYGESRSHATVSYRLQDGYQPDASDCAYNQGLLSQVPVLFGMAAAEIEHDICQVNGADRCVYVVAWKRRRLGKRRRRIQLLEDQLRTVSERADALQLHIIDLVSQIGRAHV